MAEKYKPLKIKTLSIISLLFAPLAAPLLAQPAPPPTPTETSHPADSTRTLLTGQRVMQTFDFEERTLHLETLPMYWTKLPPRKGFPHYASGCLDSAFARSGRFSFLLRADGGSVAFQYDTRRIAIRPGSDFQVTAYVHLENAPHCRAKLTCTLTDRRGQAIPGSTQSSPLVAALDRQPDGWTPLDVYLPGNFPDARFLTLSLWLLQEDQWNPDALLEHAIFRYDVRAAAWFDDLSVFQLPRVVLSTDRPGNVFDSRDPFALRVEVDHVNTLDYQIRLTVRDASAQTVHQEAWLLTGVAEEPHLRTIRLPDLPAGLYYADLAILAANLRVATRTLTFARLAPLSAAPTASGARFGLLALDHDAGDWDALVALVRLANAKLLKLPVWRRTPDLPGAIFAAPDFDRQLLRLQQSDVQIMAVFSEIPDSLAAQVGLGRSSLLDVLSKDPALWQPQLAAVLAQYARQVPYWQVGADSADLAQTWDPRIRPVLAALDAQFAQLASQTVLAVPVNAFFHVAAEQLGATHVALAIPPDVAPELIPDYLADCRQRGLDTIWATLLPLEPALYRHEDRLIDFAKRLAFAKMGRAQAIFIDHPWTLRTVNARPCVEPTELLPVFRTLADQLGGADFLGRCRLAPDLPALIFDRDGAGCLFLWNDAYNPADPASASREIYLGQDAVLIDLFGNATPLPARDDGLVKLHITSRPVLLASVNTRLACFRASLRLEPAALDAVITPQAAALRVENPFNVPIAGRIRLLRSQSSQDNWLIDPAGFDFALAPAQTVAFPLTLRFPRNEIGGPKRLDLLVALDADRSYRFREQLPFDIHLSGIDFAVFARRLGPADLLVQQIITNTGPEEITLQSFVDLPDSNRLERAVPRLAPGASVTKSFRIPNAVQWLGQSLRLGLYDPQGIKRLNRSLQIN